MLSLDGWILGYGHTYCNPDWAVKTEGEHFHRLYYVVGGNCQCQIHGETFPLLSGNLYVFPCHVPYRIDHNPYKPLHVIWQHIGLTIGNLGSRLVSMEIKGGSGEYHILEAIGVLSRHQTLENVSKSMNQDVQNISKLVQVLLTIVHEKQGLYQHLDSRISEAMELVLHQPQNHYTVQDLADHVKLERCHFSRLFRKQQSMTAQDFLLHTKLDWGASLLLQGATVTTVAFDLGYEDEKSFFRAFRQHFGTTPSKYQKYHIVQP